MKLAAEFFQLPLQFDVQKLQEEVAQFTEADWQPHPQGFPGNSALLLVTANGDPRDDALEGPMRPTPNLEKCPYLKQVLASFQTVVGRTRLMRLESSAQVTAHTDAHYYWQQRVRVHVPIQTHPDVEFICGDKTVHMGLGETWIFDTSKIHNVINPTPHTRIHLVSDTVGTDKFWSMVSESYAPGQTPKEDFQPHFVPFQAQCSKSFLVESINEPVIMSPWEQRSLIQLFLDSWDNKEKNSTEAVLSIQTLLERFNQEWMGLWSAYGDDLVALPIYQEALDRFSKRLQDTSNKININSSLLRKWLIEPALNPNLAKRNPNEKPITQEAPPQLEKTTSSVVINQPQIQTQSHNTEEAQLSAEPIFDRPIFVIAAPRSGSTFLFETLMRSPSVYSIGGESHGIFETIPELNLAKRDYESNILSKGDVSLKIKTELKKRFLSRLKDHQGTSFEPKPQTKFRFLEKTPKNALRISFLNEIFPDARFIYLYREPHENISSIIEAWKSRRFVTYPQLPNWSGEPWSLLLVPGWRELQGASLAEIAAAQWKTTHQHILDELRHIDPHRCCGVEYSKLVENPQQEIKRLCEFAGIDWEIDLNQEEIPLSKFTVTPPDPNKWKKNADVIEPLLPGLETISTEIKNFFTEINTSNHPQQPQHTSPDILEMTQSDSFSKLLDELNISIAMSSPTDNRLVTLAVDDQLKLTNFSRTFPQPTALTGSQSRLLLATTARLSFFYNMPAVAAKLEPLGYYDACYLHRNSHIVGDLQITDLVDVKQKIWGVSSRFSCLFSIEDKAFSFTPRWKPSFIKEINANDACRLSGLAIVNDQPKYVTAYAATNSPRGWRNTSLQEGVLIDVSSSQILLRNLHLPLAPRWHNDRLWILEAGRQSFGYVNLKDASVETVTYLPGRPKGMSLFSHYAFIILDNLSETSSGRSGIWVIDLNSGKVIANTIFGTIQSLFSVQVIPNTIRPDITNFEEALIGTSFALDNQSLKEVVMGAGK
ncbi:MAG: TIGR03032 family protein [Synechococcus sp.]|nr:TIGR03032 family protein [Synechococcus sp.]